MSTLPQALPADVPGVTLWWCELERTNAEPEALASPLSPPELVRAARFGTDALRHRWMAGRGALRQVLGRTLGMAPEEVVIRRGVRGRPELADTGARIDFNVTHTRGVAIVAVASDVAPTTRIGVDVEHAERQVGVDRLARKFLTPGERATLAELPLDERRRRFLHYWTCKEAMSKATGDGIIAPFGRLDVELANPPRLRAGPPPYLPADWSLHRAALPPPWIVAVAIWRRAPG